MITDQRAAVKMRVNNKGKADHWPVKDLRNQIRPDKHLLDMAGIL